MVQLSRSMDEFRDGMKRAEVQAKVFERVAEVFDTIEKAVQRVKEKLDPVFLVIAEHIAPAMEKVLSLVNNFDLSPLVDGIGEAFDVFAQAFSEGKVFELLTAGFEAAVEYLGNLIFGVLGSSKLWSGIFDQMVGQFIVAYASLAKLFMNLGVILKAAISTAFDMLFEQIGKIPGLGKMLGLAGGDKAKSFGEHYAEEKDKAKGANAWLDSTIKFGADKFSRGVSKQIEAFTDARANAGGPAQDALNDLVSGLLGRKKSAAKGAQKADKPGGDGELEPGKGQKVNATSIEKMGFVFSGGMSTDHNATTARNTTKMVTQFDRLLERKAKGNDFGDEITNTHAK